jgi:hypothetical protein
VSPNSGARSLMRMFGDTTGMHDMTGRRVVLFALLLIAAGDAITGESTETLHAYVRESSFTVTVPMGWKVDSKGEASQLKGGQKGGRVFVIVSTSPAAKFQSLAIYASFYRNMLLTEARQRWEGSLSKQSTELAPIEGLSKWTLVESSDGRSKSLTAYRVVGWDTLYIYFNTHWLNTANQALYEQGRHALLELLKSYKEEKIFYGP